MARSPSVSLDATYLLADPAHVLAKISLLRMLALPGVAPSLLTLRCHQVELVTAGGIGHALELLAFSRCYSLLQSTAIRSVAQVAARCWNPEAKP